MPTIIDLPDDLLKAVNRHAVDCGEEFSRSVVKLLRQALILSPPEASMENKVLIRIHPDTGLPYFEGEPVAKSATMSINELLDLEQQALLESDLERHSIPVR